MTGCPDDCPLEGVSQDERSAGPIDDAEVICRGAYAPMHYSGDKIKPSVVRAADLFRGDLSVWRASAQSGFSVEDVAVIVEEQGPAENKLKHLLGVSAQAIRQQREPKSGTRLFCVIDETETECIRGSRRALDKQTI